VVFSFTSTCADVIPSGARDLLFLSSPGAALLAFQGF